MDWSPDVWWIIGGIAYALFLLYVWAIMRAGAQADRDWESLIANLEQEQADRDDPADEDEQRGLTPPAV